ncbi:hypothetical protein C2S51_006637 [Perilla frutescens var. frutescens]|nr:hypothetical protein C2S51_006637 [Perilla frutescens var. frutescens]
MRRLINSKSGSSYGPKWPNVNSGSESESEDDVHSAPANSAETAESPNHEDNENQTGQVPVLSTDTVQSPNHEDNQNQTGQEGEAETMFRAAIEGEWIAAERLLLRNPNLACDSLTNEGERALHVAASMKHEKFVEKLVDWMNEDDLLLRDGHGYTACCYGAMSGVVEIVRVMIGKNSNLATAHDENNVTPLHKAAMYGNEKMVSYLLKSAKIENLSNEEWFDLLLVIIGERMFGVAIELVEKNNVLALMVKEERTSLHVLAQMDVSNIVSSNWRFKLLRLFYGQHVIELFGKKPSNFVKLAEKLWDEMQKMEKTNLLKLIKNQHILHDAAKRGHVELLTMVTRAYPQLIWDTDSNGHTIFHIGVAYRQRHVFNLIHQVKCMIHSRTISQDQDGNNILHLSAKLSPRPFDTGLLKLMRGELAWFEVTKATVPPSCQYMRNKDGLTPRELFSKEHKRLLRDSKTSMMNLADSCIIVATLVFTVLFTNAFTVPGGYDYQTGKAIHFERKSFQILCEIELFGLACSAISIILFGSIRTTSFAEYDFQDYLPRRMNIGLCTINGSLIFTVTAFMLSFQLVIGALTEMKLIMMCILGILVCAYLIGTFRQLALYNSTIVRKSRPSRHTLFNQHPTTARTSLSPVAATFFLQRD